MKTLLDIVNPVPNPARWSESDYIPWNEPDFSAQMLTENLSQEHDLACREIATVGRQDGQRSSHKILLRGWITHDAM